VRDVRDGRERSERVFEWNDGRGEEKTWEREVGKRLPVVLPDGDCRGKRERERKRDDRVQDETAEEVSSKRNFSSPLTIKNVEMERERRIDICIRARSALKRGRFGDARLSSLTTKI